MKVIISGLKEIFQTALVSLLIFFFVYVFLVQPHRVKGDSMLPNFVDGELLLTEKITYHFNNPNRGDVIVFQAPTANVDFIKRVIGVPGDTVKIADGSVSVNGKKLEEGYINVPTEGDNSWSLNKDQYFVLGDNRGASSDSRVFGTITKESIRGRVWFVYWPIFKNGSYRGIRLISPVHYSVSDSFDYFRGRFNFSASNNMHFAFNS